MRYDAVDNYMGWTIRLGIVTVNMPFQLLIFSASFSATFIFYYHNYHHFILKRLGFYTNRFVMHSEMFEQPTERALREN